MSELEKLEALLVEKQKCIDAAYEYLSKWLPMGAIMELEKHVTKSENLLEKKKQ